MEDKLKEIIAKILNTIQEARKYSQPFNGLELFRICEDLIAHQVWLIGYLLDAETKFRERVLEYREAVKTKAEAEIKAKTTEEYKNYRYLEYVYELVTQQIQLVKRFSTLLSEEKNNLGIT